MNRFWDALNSSVLVQATVTLGLLASVVYAEIWRDGATPTLVNALMLILGFWFGTKAMQVANNQKSKSEK